MTRPNPLAGYEDWMPFVQARGTFAGSRDRSHELAQVLGVPQPVTDVDVRVEATREFGGLVTTTLSWNPGYGPRTRAYLVRPADRVGEMLPGVLAFHCHGGYKWLGAEQLVDLDVDNSPEAEALKAGWYSGRAPASELARLGFAVLVPDTFGWGSRRFPLVEHTPRLAAEIAGQLALWREAGIEPTAAQLYNATANAHEDTVAKAAGVLGTSLAGMVAHDDLVALSVLASLDGVDADRLGAFGFSGGGGRSVMISALDSRIRANVVACMMATFDSLTPWYLDEHSWLLNTPGLWSYSDWPGVVRGTSTLVQYAVNDEIFPEGGMRDAHAWLTDNAPGRYSGSFYPVTHVFDAQMQAEAFEHLARELGVTPDR